MGLWTRRTVAYETRERTEKFMQFSSFMVERQKNRNSQLIWMATHTHTKKSDWIAKVPATVIRSIDFAFWKRLINLREKKNTLNVCIAVIG